MNLQLIVTRCNAIKIPSEYTNRIVATSNMRSNIIAIVLLLQLNLWGNIQIYFLFVHVLICALGSLVQPDARAESRAERDLKTYLAWYWIWLVEKTTPSLTCKQWRSFVADIDCKVSIDCQLQAWLRREVLACWLIDFIYYYFFFFKFLLTVMC